MSWPPCWTPPRSWIDGKRLNPPKQPSTQKDEWLRPEEIRELAVADRHLRARKETFTVIPGEMIKGEHLVETDLGRQYTVTLHDPATAAGPLPDQSARHLQTPDPSWGFLQETEKRCRPLHAGTRKNKDKIVGYRNLTQLHERLQTLVIRRKKEDVLSDLPDQVVNNLGGHTNRPTGPIQSSGSPPTGPARGSLREP